MNFVIIASARTGSSHLVNTLGGHPEIFCHGNVFASHMMATFWPKGNRPSPGEVEVIKSGLRNLREKDPDAFLDRVFSMNFGRQHVGFKIFRGQNDDMLGKLVADDSVRKIVLFRHNVLANYSSAMLAKESDTWDVKKGEAKDEPPRVQFDEKDFIVFHNCYMRFYRDILTSLAESRQHFHFMNYEVINDPIMLRTAMNFIGADANIGLDADASRKIQVKQNTSNILDRYSNPADVERFLTKSDRLHWKHDFELSFAPLRRASRSRKSKKSLSTMGAEAARPML